MNGKLTIGLIGLALGCLLLFPAFANDYKCTATTQECLDKMVSRYRATGWIGVSVDWVEDRTQMEVQEIVPDGPAFQAGIQVGDRIIAMNDITFRPEDKGKLGELKKNKKPGVRFFFTVLRKGKARKIAVTLGRMPDDIIATAIGPHMLDHVVAEPAKTANNHRP